MRNTSDLQNAIKSGVQLTPAQFVQQYAPTLSSAQAVEGYLTSTGAKTFESVGTPAGRLLEAADSAGPGTSYVTGRHC